MHCSGTQSRARTAQPAHARLQHTDGQICTYLVCLARLSRITHIAYMLISTQFIGPGKVITLQGSIKIQVKMSLTWVDSSVGSGYFWISFGQVILVCRFGQINTLVQVLFIGQARSYEIQLFRVQSSSNQYLGPQNCESTDI